MNHQSLGPHIAFLSIPFKILKGLRNCLASSLYLIFLLMTFHAFAATSKNDSLQFEGAIGSPQASIENPDQSTAYYDGIALQGRILIPLWAPGTFSSILTANLRYLDMKNTANNASQKEFSSQLGPGLGLRFTLGKIMVGADYFFLVDRHYSFGSISREITQEFSPVSYYAGFSMPLGTLSVGISYLMSSGTISTKSTQLNEPSPYSDSLFMVHLIWNSGISFGKFAQDLFKL